MENSRPTLFVEINKSEYIFAVGNYNKDNTSELLQKINVPIKGITNNKISNLEIFSSIIKENIFLIEQRLNCTLKDVVIIIDNFECYTTSVSGFKRLNGSQLSKENISYIINSLKLKISENEPLKTILHIFNSKYFLDAKEIDNLPIGLFGNFYSHELSFLLLNKNDYKNLLNIFNNCNLRVKRIISKSFIEGVNLTNNYQNLETFFKIDINKNFSRIFYFENLSLKFMQSFQFGSDLILEDISKVTGLDFEIVKNFLQDLEFKKNTNYEENIEEKFFKNINFRKIKKNLVFEIAAARIEEFSEIIIKKNINLNYLSKKNTKIFLCLMNDEGRKSFDSKYKKSFSSSKNHEVSIMRNLLFEDIFETANSIVHYGWSKEAIPITQEKRSVIARFFDLLFG